MVQHPGSRLEPADSSAGRRPHRPPAGPPRLFSGFLWFPGRRRLPKLPEAVQLVEEGQTPPLDADDDDDRHDRKDLFCAEMLKLLLRFWIIVTLIIYFRISLPKQRRQQTFNTNLAKTSELFLKRFAKKGETLKPVDALRCEPKAEMKE